MAGRGLRGAALRKQKARLARSVQDETFGLEELDEPLDTFTAETTRVTQNVLRRRTEATQVPAPSPRKKRPRGSSTSAIDTSKICLEDDLYELEVNEDNDTNLPSAAQPQKKAVRPSRCPTGRKTAATRTSALCSGMRVEGIRATTAAPSALSRVVRRATAAKTVAATASPARPDVNLPQNWLEAPPEDQCLYTQFTATDACFALKRRMVSSELRDPPLGPGLAYMVEPGPYREYLRTTTNQQEMSTCSGLAALEQANTKFSKGYAATGMGMVVCARHEFVFPNALHILGHTFECKNKYNLNFVPGSGQTDAEGIERTWAAAGRMAPSTKQMGPGARSDLLDSYWAFWNWWKMLGLRMSYFSLPQALIDWVAIAAALRRRRRLDNAVEERDRQMDEFEVFLVAQADSVPEWRQMVLDHEEDGSNKYPYATEVKGIPNAGWFRAHAYLWAGISEAQTRLMLREQEAKDAAAGRAASHRHEVGPTAFIEFGLSLEELQRRIRTQAAIKKSQSTAEKISLAGLRKRFNTDEKQFRTLQAAYTPDALVRLQDLHLPQDVVAEKVPLLLPSALVKSWRGASDENEGEKDLDQTQLQLLSVERQLRRGQCSTALGQLRNHLHLKWRLLLFKKNHIRHQAMNTRLRTTIAKNEGHILFHSDKYQVNWLALLEIEGGVVDAVGLRRLKKGDIRCMQDAETFSRKEELKQKQLEQRMQRIERARQEGELIEAVEMEVDAEDGEEEDEFFRDPSNKAVMSWIWQGLDVSSNAEGAEALRIQWCKAFASLRRWDEEVRIGQEETRRLSVSLEHSASTWLKCAESVPVGAVPTAEAEGMMAYCLKSAAMYKLLLARAQRVAKEAKVARGWRRRREVVVDDPLGLGQLSSEVDLEADPETDTDEEELLERGDVDSEDEWGAQA
uniref:CxC2-like cysteine cluster KDZ transposase-associated domain-containing protein n=1 Tax=Mycena chlorophos TaxID=658473 RepID=A0ABQ0LD19_MYCCL|nr:predicted protein [Mycena chlorophos]